jgi:AcrR family transcriptional regulator
MTDAPAEPRPLRADAERNRRRILTAAGEVFAERGLTATLDAVAERAGVGVGTVYRRFPDKEALVDALFEERIEEVRALAEEALTIDDAFAALGAFLERATAMHLDDRALKELVFSTAHGQERVARARDTIAPVVGRLVERAHASGQLRADAALTDIPMVQLMLTSVIEYAAEVSPDLWRRYLAVVLDGLRAGHAATPMRPDPLSEPEMDGVMARGLTPPRR